MIDWTVTDNVHRDAWRRVLDFANLDFTYEAIVARHGIPVGKSASANYRKQALQVRVALLQAREYFIAAESATLITQPNHVYYGMMSLASAVMLLLGPGTKSFDYLRNDTGNRHHGLRFTVGANAAEAAKDINLLNTSVVEVLNHGHFLNWHAELPTHEPAFADVRYVGEGRIRRTFESIGYTDLAKTPDLIGRVFRTTELLMRLPDLATDLLRYGLPLIRTRSDHEVVIDPSRGTTHTWRLHGSGSPQALMLILEQFRFPIGLHERVSVSAEENATGCLVTINLPKDGRLSFAFPACRHTADFQHIVYADDHDLPEFVDMYLVAFSLSMLSRYYPDLWISCLDSHCRSAKLIEATTALLQRKAPVLALELMLGQSTVFSTQRPPWFT